MCWRREPRLRPRIWARGPRPLHLRQWSASGLSSLLLFDFDDFAPFILAAVWAYAVREFGLVTVGTLGKPGSFQRIMRAAIAGAPLGVSTFGIRHVSSFSLFPCCLGFYLI